MTGHDPLATDRFREVMSRFATGVTVMTCHVEGEPHGMTANAITSVSLDPTLVLVCVARSAEMCRWVRDAGAFALSILPAGDEAVSTHFADAARPLGHDQFAGVPTRPGLTGSPILLGALGWLDCRVWAIHDGGDHDIVVGHVLSCDIGADGDALGWFRSRYVTVPRPPDLFAQ